MVVSSILRPHFGFLALCAVVVAVPLVACGSREWTHSTPAPPTGPAPSAPALGAGSASAPPFISATADPICGDNWKWDGIRCNELEPIVSEDPALAAGLPTKPAGRSRGGASTGSPKLLMADIKPGTGKEARRSDNVRVHYVGTLPDGTEFDSSRRRDTPLEFRLGTGAVIKGFDSAIVGMKVGGIRRVTIPPELGYGRQGSPPRIPPNATLIFEVELVDVD